MGKENCPTDVAKAEGFTVGTVDDLYKKEANLLEEIAVFNKQYYFYVANCLNRDGSAKDPGTVPVDEINNPSSQNCSNLKITMASDATNLQNNIVTDPTLITSLPNYYSDYNTDKVNNAYSKLVTDYSDMVKMRADLDQKLRELYDIPGSKSLDYRYNLDSTIYSGILVTIIASAVVFYAFTRLD
jgi:hypothetical protein